jgi:hypothetical protein
MSDPKIRFEEAIERLYTTFAGYPLPGNTGMCSCSYNPEDELKLHSKPLRDLSGDDLDSYSWSALLTWGDDYIFRHFLPRMFELEFQVTYSYILDPEHIAGKLNLAEWRTWPVDEIEAVQSFLMAAWEYALASDDYSDIDDLLSAIGQAEDDMSPYLEAWEKSGIVGLSYLSEFITAEYAYIAQSHILTNIYWQDKSYEGDPFCNDRTTQMNQVIEWLEKPSTCELLENAFLENPNHPLSATIAEGADYLRWIETYRKNTT